MNEAIWKAMCLALQQECANGEPLTATPEHLRQSGPCPKCGWRIDPSDFSHASGYREDAEIVCIIVCGRCAEPLLYHEAGKFEILPKKLRRRLPNSTRAFIERSQEMVRAINRLVN